MGIPSYFSYVLKNHFKIIKQLKQTPCNLLLIDANSFIYDVIHEGKTDIKEAVYLKIMNLISLVKAKKTLVAFDGVVPLAKMKQQKQRRYKSYVIKTVLKKEGWNTNAITPGTQFMNELDLYLKDKLSHVLYSGPNEKGEGEQKLFSYLKENPTPHTIIYGLDADLIMLSLLHCHLGPIFLYRETKYFKYLKGIDEKKDYVFSIDEMAIQISECLYDSPHPIKKSVENYCFLCFLCGNDFLPHFPSINIRNEGIPFLLETFKSVLKEDDLVNGTNILWTNVKRLFTELSKVEKAMMETNIKWKMGLKTYSKNKEDELNNLPLREIKEDYLIDHYEDYYPFLFGQEEHGPICKKYIQMLEWTLYYYNGICKDHYICYDFHLAPLFSSLLNHIPCFNCEEVLTVNKREPPSTTSQLLYVLPYVDFHLIQDRTAEKFFPQLKCMNFPIETHFCKFFWESHVDFNYISLIELDQQVRSKPLD